MVSRTPVDFLLFNLCGVANLYSGLCAMNWVGVAVTILAVVLLVNNVARKVGPEVSWVIGANVTGVIYAMEGDVVAGIQSVATPWLTAYLSFMYICGYVFLLVFPLVAYLVLEDARYLRELCWTYSFTYGIGLLCYVVFIAYGPRNLIPDVIDPLLYSGWPRAKLITSQVNTNTNAFPSLHAALSLAVMGMAYRTRSEYPRWFAVAVAIGVSVVVSTMYLGIHWLVDVLGGVILSSVALQFAEWAVDFDWARSRFGGSMTRVYRVIR
jgi:membrane-associated phospholipid phosphatase